MFLAWQHNGVSSLGAGAGLLLGPCHKDSDPSGQSWAYCAYEHSSCCVLFSVWSGWLGLFCPSSGNHLWGWTQGAFAAIFLLWETWWWSSHFYRRQTCHADQGHFLVLLGYQLTHCLTYWTCRYYNKGFQMWQSGKHSLNVMKVNMRAVLKFLDLICYFSALSSLSSAHCLQCRFSLNDCKKKTKEEQKCKLGLCLDAYELTDFFQTSYD